MTTQTLLYIVGALALVFVALFVFLLISRNRNRTQSSTRKQLELQSKKDAKNHLYTLYRIYMATPLIRRYYVKLKNNYRAIIPADEVTLNKKTTERMSLCIGICLLILIAICLVGGGDIAYMMVGFLACYIVFTNLINTSEQKMQMKLLNQLDTLVSDVHSNYPDSKIPDEALSSTLDNLPYEIGLHANIVNDMLKASDTDLEVEKYIDMAPNKFLLLFATICATIQEHGDKALKNGRSMFIQNLDYLKTELGNERIRLSKRTLAFAGKTFSVLIPLFCLKPIQIWAESNMPEIAGFYKGSGGIISLAIVMVITYICYEFINILKDDHNPEGKSDKLYRDIANLPVCKKYITSWINHNYTKSERTNDKLKSVGDTSGMPVFIVKRFLVAIVMFLLVNVVSIIAINSDRATLINDFSDAYTNSLVPTQEYRENMRDMSAMYTWEIKHGYTDEEFLEVIGGDLDPAYATMVAGELAERAEEYQSHYYKAYMLLLALVAAVIGFQIPMFLLNYKQRIMGMAREDEVAQFRTLILILMHEDGMTLDKILEWMERFAHAFKPSITECILNLESDEQQALEDMREAESGFAPFRQLCDSLLSVDKVGLEDAFDSLEIDRHYYQEKRKEDNEAVLRKCTSQANMLQFLPVWAVIGLYLIVPIAIYAISMYNEINFSL